MNQHALHIELLEPNQAREAVRSVFLPFCGRYLDQGKRLAVTVCELEDAKSVQQRRYYHGVVLKEIAEQAVVNGEKFDLKVWKNYCREKFLGSKWEVSRDPMTGKKKRRKVRISTEDLGIKAYSQLIEQTTAFAVTDLGVAFSLPNWESYR